MPRLNLFRTLILLPIIYCLSQSVMQARQLSTQLNYQTEPLAHTTENDGLNYDWLGWLTLNSTYELNKHQFHLDLSLTHGGLPSVNVVGDLQTFSNLEAGFLYGIYQMYYRYGNDTTWLKLGQIDINTDFAVSQTGAFFTHSSFGIDPILSVNTPAPTYPVAGFSLSSRVQLAPKIFLRTAIFDGQFAEPEKDYLRLDWSLSLNDGLIYLIEPEVKLFEGKMTQKLGFYRHSGRNSLPGVTPSDPGLTSLYLIGDIKDLKWMRKTVSTFYQFNYSTGNKGPIDFYLGAGFVMDSPFGKNNNHQLGIAIGHASINTNNPVFNTHYSFTAETAIELSYRMNLSQSIFLQPYVHQIYFHNSDKKPAYVLALRANFDLHIFGS